MVVKTKTILEALAIIGSVGGSLLLAANLHLETIGYIFFLVGSVATIKLMQGTNVSRSLVYINFYFVCINVVGLVRHF